MSTKYDYLIVGAGFAGSVFAECLASAGKKVLVVEKREHVGGNCYDYYDETGILVHLYGPHIFHTNSQQVWEYLSKFTQWLSYQHHVLARVDGQILTLPVNLNTIYELLPEPQAGIVAQKLIEAFGQGQRVPILKLRASNDRDLRALAELVYEKIYLNYTRKQWGRDPDELDPQVTERVPVWVDRDNRYFKDKYQGIPREGYTKMIEKILDHPNIELCLNKDYKKAVGQFDFDKLIYTGPIDRFFDYKHGQLPYRSLHFDFETLDKERLQDVAVVNYPGEEPFTRITEFKHFSGQRNAKTSILKEYPQVFRPDKNIPCYPIPRTENFDLYQKYENEAAKHKNIIFIGRLAEYKYYNMDEVVGRSLKLFKTLPLTD